MHWRNHLTMLNTWIHKPRVGLITDVDGTISPIVDSPDDARVTPRSRQLLTQLQTQLAVVGVVSGRAVADVARRVGIPDLVYMGNHGMEHWQDGQAVVAPEIAEFRPNIQSAIDSLTPRLMEGMFIEDKQTTISIHFRKAPFPDTIEKEFFSVIQRIAEDNDLDAFAGRMIFEIRPRVNVNKGVAFQHIVETYDLDAAMFIGDDITDVDAFRMAKRLHDSDDCYSLAVGVESSATPPLVVETADMMVSGVSDVESLLEWLSNARIASST